MEMEVRQMYLNLFIRLLLLNHQLSVLVISIVIWSTIAILEYSTVVYIYLNVVVLQPPLWKRGEFVYNENILRIGLWKIRIERLSLPPYIN